MFAYCNNNPVLYSDSSGAMLGRSPEVKINDTGRMGGGLVGIGFARATSSGIAAWTISGSFAEGLRTGLFELAVNIIEPGWSGIIFFKKVYDFFSAAFSAADSGVKGWDSLTPAIISVFPSPFDFEDLDYLTKIINIFSNETGFNLSITALVEATSNSLTSINYSSPGNTFSQTPQTTGGGGRGSNNRVYCFH